MSIIFGSSRAEQAISTMQTYGGSFIKPFAVYSVLAEL